MTDLRKGTASLFQFLRRGRRKAVLDATARIMELEDAVTTMLDIATGWTRPMEDAERFKYIEQVGTEALRGTRSWRAPDEKSGV